MKALQLYYTSCEHGYEKSPGFQVKAISEGFEEDEINKIKKAGRYNTPRNLPPQPSLDEIRTLFPVAFRYQKNESNQYSFMHSAYVGKDYSGPRYGNYFMHALLFESQLNFWPIDLYHWEGWKSEDNSKETSLPVIDIELNNSVYSFNHLQQFLNEEDNRTIFHKMLSAFILSQKDERKIVIRSDDKENSILWMAALQKSFPVYISSDISLSSYQYSPGSCSDINIVYGETDFTFDDTEFNYHFYVFDFLDGRESDLENIQNTYVNFIVDMLSTNPHKLQKFYSFAEYFKTIEIRDRLEDLLKVFQLIDDDMEQFSQTELKDILAFVSEYTKNEYYEFILKRILSTLDQTIEEGSSFAYLDQFILFYSDAYARTAHGEYKDILLRLFSNLIKDAYINDNYDKEKVRAIESRLKKSISNFEYDFSKYFLEQQNIEIYLKNETMKDNTKLYSLLGRIIDSTKRVFKEIKLSDNDLVTEYIAHLLQLKKEELHDFPWEVINYFDSTEEKSDIIFMISREFEDMQDVGIISDIDYDVALESLAYYLQKHYLKDIDDYYHLINTLCHYDTCWLLADKEYNIRLGSSSNKIAFFDNYNTKILEKNIIFKEKNFLNMIEVFWKSLSEKEKVSKAVEWVVSDEIDTLKDLSIWQDIMQKANNGISFSLSDKTSLIIEKYFQQYIDQADFEPNKIILRQAIISTTSDSDYEKISQALKNISSSDYKEFLNSFLSPALKRCKNTEDYGNMIKNTLIPEYYEIFLEIYFQLFIFDKDVPLNTLEVNTWRFWISVTQKEDNIYNLIRKDVMNHISDRFSILPSSALKELEEIKDLPPAQKRKLNELLKKASEQKNTFLEKISKNLSSKANRLLNIWRKN